MFTTDMIQSVVAGQTVCGRAGPSFSEIRRPAGPLQIVTMQAGVTGFSFNLEVYGDEPALAIMPRKHRRSTPHFERTATAAVELLGSGTGAVRSIVILGLDDLDTTVEAIEMIAGLGLDPVLSPVRPAQGTALEASSPPDESFLLEVWAAANEIADKHDVALGPRCIPCQHNILALPWRPAYSYFAEGNVHGGAA